VFTGIIETTGIIDRTEKKGSNLNLWIRVPFIHELKIDQSVAHNGVCLTIAEIDQDAYMVTAIDETLRLTNLGELKTGDQVNIERCMPVNGRFDGHIVQGHVDGTAGCNQIEEKNGSWLLSFATDHPDFHKYMVRKGSVTVNGISLTIADLGQNEFTVAIIPYTWEHTNLSQLKPGSTVNIEFDILGKYVAQQLAFRSIQS
jgi:riboflavin synthase